MKLLTPFSQVEGKSKALYHPFGPSTGYVYLPRSAKPNRAGSSPSCSIPEYAQGVTSSRPWPLAHKESYVSAGMFHSSTAFLIICAVARPYMYGLAAGGQQGVEQVLKSILADLEITLGLSGYKSLDEIQGQRGEIVVKMT